MTYNELAIVVPIRSGEPRRDLIWRWVRERYERLAPGAELVLGQSEAPVFSRSEAINNGLRLVTNMLPRIKTVLIADADHVLHDRWLAESFDIIRDGGSGYWSVPKVHVFLEERMSNVWLECSPGADAEMLPGFLPSDVDEFLYTGVSGLVMCSLEAMREARGFDERFDGWGLQDAGFAVAITALGYERIKEHWCGHLWHPKNQAEPTGVGQQFGNWDHFRRYENAPEEVVRGIIAEPKHDRGWWA